MSTLQRSRGIVGRGLTLGAQNLGSILACCGGLAVGCNTWPNPNFAHVDNFVRAPVSAERVWLSNGQIALAPLASGSIHTSIDLTALPPQFSARFPDAKSYRPLWARERDLALFIHAELHRALARRLVLRAASARMVAPPPVSELEQFYHSSGQPALGGIRPTLFDPRAASLGDTPLGDDAFAPFRKAYLVPSTPTAEPAIRLVTGYFGIHCLHELVGRHNTDWKFTQMDWLAALADDDAHVIAEAYVGARSNTWKCPVSTEVWEELLDSIADAVVDALRVPTRD